MLDAQLRQMPQLGPYANVLRDFYHEQMSWTVVETELTSLYMDVFTEPELNEMIAFFQSPLGQKMLDKMPVLMAKSNELTNRRLQVAMPQLMQRMQAAIEASASTQRGSAAPAQKRP